MNSSYSEPSASKEKFKCTEPNCNASFSKNRKLLSHIRIHTGERPFVCDEHGCNKSYTNSSHLIRHKKVSHSEKTSQTVLCEFPNCGLVLANKYSLKKHYNRKHNPEVYPFRCTECSQGFHRKKQLQKHSYIHTGEAPFSCDACEISFTAGHLLNKHKRSHRLYKCHCGEVFHTWSWLLAHKKSCKKPRYTCTVCHKTFSHPGNLKSHKLVHLNQSERLVFTCPYAKCERYYFYKKNLKTHINNYHKRINQNQIFKCTYPKCQVVLRTKPSLKRHLQSHFKWTLKKKRLVRSDKGKPKKSMASFLVGTDLYIEKSDKNDEENTENQNDQQMITENQPINNSVCVPAEISDNSLLEQCDITIRTLNEKIMAAG